MEIKQSAIVEKHMYICVIKFSKLLKVTDHFNPIQLNIFH